MAKESLYRTWESESQKQEAYAQTYDNVEAYDGIQKAVGYGQRTSYIDIEPNRSVRTSFLREDYDNFRPGEQVPTQQKRIIKMCMQAYDKVGIVRNVIDLMSDFAAQGLTIVHPNKNIERFYRKWFNQVSGVDRSERFLNYLYRCGNVIVKRRTAKLSRDREQELLKTSGADIELSEIKVKKREIPWIYDFLNPVAVDVKDYGMQALGKPQFVLNISKYTHETLLKSANVNKTVFQTLPNDLQKLLSEGSRVIPLDPENVSFYHYKKDDWLIWANPMIYAILDDIIMLEKMKLADLAALDGAISNVRLWTIGDLDNKIIPTKAAINKLRDILASNVGGGTMDLVWGPELKFTESQSQVYRFLGSEKYQPVLTSIYAGLGIPPTLTGASTSGGFTNNYVSLKTLIERLEYGREILAQFWRKEIELVRKAMGFRLPAEIHFDSIILSDEAAQKQLLIQLADRDIISHETLLERFRELPSIERVRVRREEKDRRDDVMPDKASPYHRPQHRDEIAKIALNKDLLSNEYLEDMGLPTSDNSSGPSSNPSQSPISNTNNKEVKTPGRPLLSGDKTKRKSKRVLPRGETTAILWGVEAQDKISAILTPIALKHFNKTNVRSLTKSELSELNKLKVAVFANLKTFSDVDEKSVKSLLDSANPKKIKAFKIIAKEKTKEFIDINKRSPNLKEIQFINSCTLVECLEINE
jgi:hypothetical protein